MPNRLMTRDEVLELVARPIFEAIKADIAANPFQPGEKRVYGMGDCLPLVVEGPAKDAV